MKLSLHDHILKRFREHWKQGRNDFVNSQAIQDWGHANVPHKKPGAHYKHETIGRCLRTLTEEGHLEKQEDISVSYRYIPSNHEVLSMNMKKKLYE